MGIVRDILIGFIVLKFMFLLTIFFTIFHYCSALFNHSVMIYSIASQSMGNLTIYFFESDLDALDVIAFKQTVKLFYFIILV